MSHPFTPSPWATVAAVARALETASATAPPPLRATLHAFARRLEVARQIALRLAA